MKKLLSVILSLAVVIAAVSAFGVSASAIDFFPDAINAKSGKQIEMTMSSRAEKIYKFTLAKKGDLVFKIAHNSSNYFTFTLMDSDGGDIGKTLDDAKAGYWSSWGSAYSAYSRNGAFSGTITYTLSKGTYYLKLYSGAGGLIEFTPTYPSKAENEISQISLTLAKGSTAQLGAVLSDGKAGTAKWSSSKESVASVNSKGKVTAKSKGTAVITAKVGNTSVKITIKVTG